MDEQGTRWINIFGKMLIWCVKKKKKLNNENKKKK